MYYSLKHSLMATSSYFITSPGTGNWYRTLYGTVCRTVDYRCGCRCATGTLSVRVKSRSGSPSDTVRNEAIRVATPYLSKDPADNFELLTI
jgi:hypothetical protein